MLGVDWLKALDVGLWSIWVGQPTNSVTLTPLGELSYPALAGLSNAAARKGRSQHYRSRALGFSLSETTVLYFPGEVQGLLSWVLPLVWDRATFLTLWLGAGVRCSSACRRWQGVRDRRRASVCFCATVQQISGSACSMAHSIGASSPATPISSASSTVLPR